MFFKCDNVLLYVFKSGILLEIYTEIFMNEMIGCLKFTSEQSGEGFGNGG